MPCCHTNKNSTLMELAMSTCPCLEDHFELLPSPTPITSCGDAEEAVTFERAAVPKFPRLENNFNLTNPPRDASTSYDTRKEPRPKTANSTFISVSSASF
jgi:hypothetical protein